MKPWLATAHYTAHYKERAARRLIHPGRKKAVNFLLFVTLRER